jgi:uncharacterized metal-binding protein
VDTETGEFGERRLTHREEAEKFYDTLKERNVRVGMEASGHARGFERLLNGCMQSCAHIVLDTADIVRDGDITTTILHTF